MTTTRRIGGLCDGWLAWRGVALTLAVGLLSACAGPVVAVSGEERRSYQHRDLGYRIEHPGPAVKDGAWRRKKVEGADLVFVGPDGAVMSLLHQCRETAASVELLARNLLIGLEDRVVRHSVPLEHAGDPGWSLVFDAQQDGVPVRVKTVTLRNGTCVYDWILVAPGAFRGPEQIFDHWWASFVGPPVEQTTAELAP